MPGPQHATAARKNGDLNLVRKLSWKICGAALSVLLVVVPFSSISAQGTGVSLSELANALHEGNYASALKISGELLRNDPKSPKLWSLRAFAYEHLGQNKQALLAYQRAIAIAPDFMPALEGAAEIQYKTKPAEAIPLLRRIVALQPANKTAHAMFGALESRQKQCGPAVQDFAAAGDILGAQPDALILYGVCLAHLGRHAESVVEFQKLLLLQPNNSIARYNLALEQWRSSAPDDALTTLQPLLDVHPPDSHALRLAAAIHESRNETPQAVELLRAAILAAPDDESSYLDFATLAFMHGSYSVGVDLVSAGLTRLPKSAGLYMARGVLYAQNGDFEKAMDDFEHAHELDPVYSMTASAEGIALSQRHDPQAALDQFRRQVREHPRNALGYYLLAEALSWTPTGGHANGSAQSSGASSSAESIAMATKAVELNPRLVQAWDLLASQYLDIGQLEPAIKAARTALSLNSRDQQALYTLILALRKKGSRDELNQLVQRLTEVRKEEDVENNRTKRYGRLVEVP